MSRPSLQYDPQRAVWWWGDGGDHTPPHTLRAGEQIRTGPGVATVLPDLDFETYSEAGFVWDVDVGKWRPPAGAKKYGLPVVGAAAYALHPTTEVLSCYYDLKDGYGGRHWAPGKPPPLDLLAHVAALGPIEAHNITFEFFIWNAVCTRRYGWPALSVDQLHDSAAKARAHALPGSLGDIGKVLDLHAPKLDDGKRLIKLFTHPRQPSKYKPETRVHMHERPEDAGKFIDYNQRDIEAEAEVSARTPDLPPDELTFMRHTLRCNARGVQLDTAAVEACADVLGQALERYDGEVRDLTGGVVERCSQLERLRGWLAGLGVHTRSLDEEHLAALLERDDLPDPARRALDLRRRAGSASVKKLYAMLRQASPQGRLHDLFRYHGARTGRDTGADVQPQNLPKAGPSLVWCEGCGTPNGAHRAGGACWRCHLRLPSGSGPWGHDATEAALEVLHSRSLDWVEHCFGDALATITGCIRGLFVAAPGYDLICSDYSSIEAVVTAVLAGEQWRIDAFHRGEDIYLHGASGVTGISYDEYQAHRSRTGEKHPDRSKIGKPAELGLGFGGWIGAWRQFDKSDTFDDDDVKRNILAWRDASPAVVEFWGGQVRGKPWRPERAELYGLEGAAIAATQHPGHTYGCRGINYAVRDDVLYCRLLSGRLLTYHRPRLAPSTRWDGQLSLSYEGWNSNPQMGPMGWVRIATYGGRLAENVIQATARDIMRDAVDRLERAGYPIVLRVHDELVAEVPVGTGSVEQFESLMAERADWYADWPVRCGGGWRGHRFRKD